mmetsp:Transcript_9951/g.27219  ORF Transcript_9951/g.27219 Transcript_9951/m.27219 type:complete len:211 (+) Transcript_9951:50-682(+)
MTLLVAIFVALLMPMVVSMTMIMAVIMGHVQACLPAFVEGISFWGNEFIPVFLAQLEFLGADQASVQGRHNRILVFQVSNDHNLLLSISIRLVPKRSDGLLQSLGPVRLVDDCPPWIARIERVMVAGQREVRLELRTICQPAEPLGSQDGRFVKWRTTAVQHGLEGLFEFGWMKGLESAVGHAADAVLLCLGSVLPDAFLLQPAFVLLGL